MDTEKTCGVERCAYCLWAGQPCVACDSLGYIVVEQPARECSHCGGQGRLEHSQQLWGLRCQACLGTGWQAVMLAYAHVSSVAANHFTIPSLSLTIWREPSWLRLRNSERRCGTPSKQRMQTMIRNGMPLLEVLPEVLGKQSTFYPNSLLESWTVMLARC